MARISQKINLKSGKRMKQLCDELHITQKRLSEASGISENTLSKIATGKCPLTRQVAEEIIKVCPSYRIEWLLGFDDQPHEYKELKLQAIEDAAKCLAAVDLLNELGFSVGQVNSAELFFPASTVRGFSFENKPVEIRHEDVIVWRGDMREIDTALLEICDFSLFKIEMLKKQMEGK